MATNATPNEINTLEEANNAIENDLLLKVTTPGPEDTTYYTASSDGWQEGHARLGQPSHKTVDASTVREAVLNAINGEGRVTAIPMEESPWGENQHFAVTGAL